MKGSYPLFFYEKAQISGSSLRWPVSALFFYFESSRERRLPTLSCRPTSMRLRPAVLRAKARRSSYERTRLPLTPNVLPRCRNEIAKCLIAEALPKNDLEMMVARYWLNEKPEDVAERYGYSRPGMYKRFNLGLEKLIRVRDAMRKRKE